MAITSGTSLSGGLRREATYTIGAEIPVDGGATQF
jgi:hypothetical protein